MILRRERESSRESLIFDYIVLYILYLEVQNDSLNPLDLEHKFMFHILAGSKGVARGIRVGDEAFEDGDMFYEF